jgi:hypothetical protein
MAENRDELPPWLKTIRDAKYTAAWLVEQLAEVEQTVTEAMRRRPNVAPAPAETRAPEPVAPAPKTRQRRTHSGPSSLWKRSGPNPDSKYKRYGSKGPSIVPIPPEKEQALVVLLKKYDATLGTALSGSLPGVVRCRGTLLDALNAYGTPILGLALDVIAESWGVNPTKGAPATVTEHTVGPMCKYISTAGHFNKPKIVSSLRSMGIYRFAEALHAKRVAMGTGYPLIDAGVLVLRDIASAP